MDRMWEFLMRRPLVVALVVLLGFVLLPVAVWLDLRNMSDASLHTQARNFNAMISDIRSYYARNVIGRIASHPGKTTPLHNYADVDGAIPIPATLSIELGSIVSERGDGFGYRFVSDYAFTSRKPHQLDAFETGALATFREAGHETKVVSEVTGSIFDRRIRVAVPVTMGGACIQCHNTHPESPKRDWKVGDIRGIQTVTVGQSVITNLGSFRYLISYLAVAGTIGIAFTALQWRQASRFHRLNAELGEANSFLAAISMKISKYLPPQVYRSIFSGDRDVAISTERKKLTIFFSDIKDFTLASETLQPEELTQLLNEYFTEMSMIAAEHGATLDKFIGDAILAFFGDPETKGVREDARACVAMAMAMQRRLEELNRDWKSRGIERPFLARMGINTGYCNVGNFGSADRMDYTIIGAEANLAARLESIAPPSGIVMSYETYAHVTDMVEAEKRPPITLKGITRDIVPYEVKNCLAFALDGEATSFKRDAPGVLIDLDLRELDEADVRATQRALKAALDAIRRVRPDVASPEADQLPVSSS